MTEQEVINLSNEVAELIRIHPKVTAYFKDDLADDVVNAVVTYELWLHDDWQRLMPLAIEHGINLSFMFGHYVLANSRFSEQYADHPTKERAVAVSILRALKAKKEKD